VSYYLLALTVALAAWTVANVSTSLFVCAWWRHAIKRVERMPSASRTRVLFIARIAPTFSATFIAAIVVPSFHRFEPRGSNEAAGWMLSALAAMSLVLVLPAVVSGLRALTMTRRLRQLCERTAIPVDVEGSTVPTLRVESDFPIVAVVGAVRPRLYIARQVLETCDSDEIASIVAHEENHVSHFDNLRRLIMDCCPDVLRFTRAGTELAADWHLGAEECADDGAASTRPGASEHLASALVRVARLAASSTPRAFPASALFNGDNIERRVRRLLRDEPSTRTRRMSTMTQLAIALCVMAIWLGPASRAV
jgi:beta-lactamase regulating signal transducer with metallopeptidase domain